MTRKYSLQLPSGARLSARIREIERVYGAKLESARQLAGDNQVQRAKIEAEITDYVKFTVASLVGKSCFESDEYAHPPARRAKVRRVPAAAGAFIENSQPKEKD